MTRPDEFPPPGAVRKLCEDENRRRGVSFAIGVESARHAVQVGDGHALVSLNNLLCLGVSILKPRESFTHGFKTSFSHTSRFNNESPTPRY
jgi:hypothetical protein